MWKNHTDLFESNSDAKKLALIRKHNAFLLLPQHTTKAAALLLTLMGGQMFLGSSLQGNAPVPVYTVLIVLPLTVC